MLYHYEGNFESLHIQPSNQGSNQGSLTEGNFEHLHIHLHMSGWYHQGSINGELTGLKSASGAWKRSPPTFITLPSGSCSS